MKTALLIGSVLCVLLAGLFYLQSYPGFRELAVLGLILTFIKKVD